MSSPISQRGWATAIMLKAEVALFAIQRELEHERDKLPVQSEQRIRLNRVITGLNIARQDLKEIHHDPDPTIGKEENPSNPFGEGDIEGP